MSKNEFGYIIICTSIVQFLIFYFSVNTSNIREVLDLISSAGPFGLMAILAGSYIAITIFLGVIYSEIKRIISSYRKNKD